MISMKKGTQKIARYGALFRIVFSPPKNHNLSLSLLHVQLLFSGLHANLINWEKKHVLKPLDFKQSEHSGPPNDVHLPPNEVMIS